MTIAIVSLGALDITLAVLMIGTVVGAALVLLMGAALVGVALAGLLIVGAIRNDCWLERFETEACDGGSVIIKAQFAEDDLAGLFQHEFQGNYGG